MRTFIFIFLSWGLLACQETTTPEFVTDDEELLDEYSEQAIKEAEELLDVLESTPILDGI